MLTGLVDFSASVSQAPVWSKPMRLSGQDAFAYLAEAASGDTMFDK